MPFHVVQRYLGHQSPEMTARYAATAEAEFLKHKKIGAYGAAIGVSPNDIYEMAQLDKRTDRVLPNGVCLLPPLKTCDKGNACLSFGHFATDRSHLDDLVAQRADTAQLLERRRAHYRERAGRELTDDNVWVRERHRELASLDAIIAKLREQPTAGCGAGTAAGRGRHVQPAAAAPDPDPRRPRATPRRHARRHRVPAGPPTGSCPVTRPEPAVEGLRRHAQQRSDDARAAIEQALRDLRRRHQPINVNAVARRAGVSRKTLYNHADLLDRVRNHRHQPQVIPPEPTSAGHNPIIAALRNELAAQKTRYEAEIARLKAQLRQRDDELAAALGELHRQLTRSRPRPAEGTTKRPDGTPNGPRN